MNKKQRLQILRKIAQEKAIESGTPASDVEAKTFADSVFEEIWNQTIDAEINKL